MRQSTETGVGYGLAALTARSRLRWLVRQLALNRRLNRSTASSSSISHAVKLVSLACNLNLQSSACQGQLSSSHLVNTSAEPEHCTSHRGQRSCSGLRSACIKPVAGQTQLRVSLSVLVLKRLSYNLVATCGKTVCGVGRRCQYRTKLQTCLQLHVNSIPRGDEDCSPACGPRQWTQI